MTSLTGKNATQKTIHKAISIPVTLSGIIIMHIKRRQTAFKVRVGENGGLNQSKHQNSTIQVTRFFLFDRTLPLLI
jgi:hypothetical protein